ncbi:unnamed protein product [Auanema sp. JU1783]|nr:unnamed protein product [Auanema sp. JU1783]
MQIDCEESLTSWLVKELGPICDAEPSALAKYVVALVRKQGKTDEELKFHITEQLEDFLHGHTKKFSDKLFTVLKSKSYMATTTTTTAKSIVQEPKPKAEMSPVKDKKEEPAKVTKEKEEIKPTTSSGSDRDEKRRNASAPRREEKRDLSSNRSERTERRRISPPAVDVKKDAREREQREFQRRKSRSPRNRRERRRSPEYSRSRHNRRSRSRSNERRERKDEKTKRRCRDYHEAGFCSRADNCQFFHGPDPVVLDDIAMDKFVNNNQKAPAPNFSVPPPGYNTLNPPPPGVEGNFVSAPVEGYNPEAPGMACPAYSFPPPPIPMHMNWGGAPYQVPPQGNMIPYDNAGLPIDSGTGGPIRNTARGRGRGGNVNMGTRVPNRGDNKTIQVKKIPPEQNNISKLNEHFASFGTIVNLQVHFNGDPESALITYNSRQEAVNAMKSPTPVLNNRFIKLFWYNPENNENTQSGSPSAPNGAGHRSDKSAPPPVVNQPPPKVATVREAKFVNPAVLESRNALSALKGSLKEHKARRNVGLDVQKKTLTFLEKLVDKQRIVISALRENKEVEKKKKLKDIAQSLSEKITVAKTDHAKQMEEIKKLSEIITDIESQIKARSAGNEESRNSESPPLKEEGTVTVVTTKNLLKENAGEAEDWSAQDPLTLLVKGFESDQDATVQEQLSLFGDIIEVKNELSSNGKPEKFVTYKAREDAEMALLTGIVLNEVPLSITPQDGFQNLNTNKLLQGIDQNDVSS